MLYLVIAIFWALIDFFIMWFKNGRKVDQDVVNCPLITGTIIFFVVMVCLGILMYGGPLQESLFTKEKVDETYSIKFEGGNAFIQQGSDWKFLRIYFDDYTFKEDPSATVPRIEHKVTHLRPKPGVRFWFLGFSHDDDETYVIVVPEGYLDEWLKALH